MKKMLVFHRKARARSTLHTIFFILTTSNQDWEFCLVPFLLLLLLLRWTDSALNRTEEKDALNTAYVWDALSIVFPADLATDLGHTMFVDSESIKICDEPRHQRFRSSLYVQGTFFRGFNKSFYETKLCSYGSPFSSEMGALLLPCTPFTPSVPIKL